MAASKTSAYTPGDEARLFHESGFAEKVLIELVDLGAQVAEVSTVDSASDMLTVPIGSLAALLPFEQNVSSIENSDWRSYATSYSNHAKTLFQLGDYGAALHMYSKAATHSKAPWAAKSFQNSVPEIGATVGYIEKAWAVDSTRQCGGHVVSPALVSASDTSVTPHTVDLMFDDMRENGSDELDAVDVTSCLSVVASRVLRGTMTCSTAADDDCVDWANIGCDQVQLGSICLNSAKSAWKLHQAMRNEGRMQATADAHDAVLSWTYKLLHFVYFGVHWRDLAPVIRTLNCDKKLRETSPKLQEFLAARASDDCATAAQRAFTEPTSAADAHTAQYTPTGWDTATLDTFRRSQFVLDHIAVAVYLRSQSFLLAERVLEAKQECETASRLQPWKRAMDKLAQTIERTAKVVTSKVCEHRLHVKQRMGACWAHSAVHV